MLHIVPCTWHHRDNVPNMSRVVPLMHFQLVKSIGYDILILYQYNIQTVMKHHNKQWSSYLPRVCQDWSCSQKNLKLLKAFFTLICQVDINRGKIHHKPSIIVRSPTKLLTLVTKLDRIQFLTASIFWRSTITPSFKTTCPKKDKKRIIRIQT